MLRDGPEDSLIGRHRKTPPIRVKSSVTFAIRGCMDFRLCGFRSSDDDDEDRHLRRRRSTALIVSISLAPVAIGAAYLPDRQVDWTQKKEQASPLKYGQDMPPMTIDHATGAMPPGTSGSNLRTNSLLKQTKTPRMGPLFRWAASSMS